MIKLQIIGNLGKDCIVNNVNGKNVINFSVAHTEKFKNKEGNVEERTTWVECAYWTDKTTVAEYLKKGRMVYAEGSPSADPYMNKENNPAATLRMRVFNLQLLGTNSHEQGATSGYVSNAGSQPQPSMKSETQEFEKAHEATDDLPF